MDERAAADVTILEHLFESLAEAKPHLGSVAEPLIEPVVETVLDTAIEALEPCAKTPTQAQPNSSTGTFILWAFPIFLLEPLFLHAAAYHNDLFFHHYNFLYLFSAGLMVVLTFLIPFTALTLIPACFFRVKNPFIGLSLTLPFPIGSLVLLYWGEGYFFPHAASVMQQLFFSF